MQNYIQNFKENIVQISTPNGSGTGFYLHHHDIIVTNQHVVQNYGEVIIDTQNIDSTLSIVLFSDKTIDIAFILAPEALRKHKTQIKLSNKTVVEGEQIFTIGHPYGLKFTATKGIVSKAKRLSNNVHYIQFDAAINPGNSGGPLSNIEGEIVGVNTFIIQGGDNLGFALPIHYLKDALEKYQAYKGQTVVRCFACRNINTAEELTGGEYCFKCGVKLEFPKTDDYKPVGNAILIEQIITQLGKNIRLSRRGKNRWEIKEGSALIEINYSEQSSFIMGDAHLALLPSTNIKEIYTFLLIENNKMKNTFFSVNGQEIILSFVIYDKYLNKETGYRIFKNHFELADYYDDILLNDFGAIEKQFED